MLVCALILLAGVSHAANAAAATTAGTTPTGSPVSSLVLPLHVFITAPAPGATIPSTGQVSFAANRTGATFTCAVDGAPLASCISPFDFGPLTAGQRLSFEVVATLGNATADASATYTVSSSAPAPLEVKITAPSPGSKIPARGQISFTANNPAAAFTCHLVGPAPTPCTSPMAYGPLTAGQPVVFAVVATVPRLKLTAAARAGYTVASIVPPPPTLPQARITSRPPARVTRSGARLAFTASSAVAGFECALDGTQFVSCRSPVTYRALARGAHTFTVRALTPGGTAGPPAVASWTVAAAVIAPPGHGASSWWLWLLLALATALAAVAVSRVVVRLLRARRRAGWQLEARAEPPKQFCQERSHYCQKTEIKLKPGRRQVAYLELHARGGDQPELTQTLDGPIIDDLNRALRDYRRHPHDGDLRASVRPAATLLVDAVGSWLPGDPGEREITTQAHLTAAEIEFEFTLYRCAKARDSDRWEHEDSWNGSLEDETDEDVARIRTSEPAWSQLESVIGQLAEFVARVDDPPSIGVSAEVSITAPA